MNELDLIKEVEKRPILYDKSVSGFNKTKLRDEAWRKVNEALNVTGEFQEINKIACFYNNKSLFIPSTTIKSMDWL